MFFDWLAMYQDHDFELPFIGDRATVIIDTANGEYITTRQPTLNHEGSFCTSIQIRISGNRVTVSGNPSRINRSDNLFGFTDLDQCVRVYNNILLSLGLPSFTKCTRTYQRQGEDGSKVETFSDGAVITELHITSNRAVGQGSTNEYIKAISTQRYRHMIPRLHTDGCTSDWLSPHGGRSSLIYPSVYNKAVELRKHALPKYLRKFGAESSEVADLNRLIDYCELHGVARFEQKLKSAFLRRHNCRFYGLFNTSALVPLHQEFLAIDTRLQVTAMSLETIADKLLRLGIVESTKAANTTTLYAMQWMAGKRFDLGNSNVKRHRARLRKIGIDIADACDLTKHSPILIRKATEIVVRDLPIPHWYRMPSVPSLRVAA